MVVRKRLKRAIAVIIMAQLYTFEYTAVSYVNLQLALEHYL